MCSCFGVIAKDNRGKIQYAYLLFIGAFTVLLCMVILENAVMLQVKNRVENVLTVSGFSGAMCDLQKMSESMSVIRHEENGQIFYDFEAMYDSASVYLDESGARERICLMLEKNIRSDGLMREIIGDYSLEELVLYNEYFDPSAVAPNGVALDTPGIYLKIKLDIRGILGKRRIVYLDKCIVVRAE